MTPTEPLIPSETEALNQLEHYIETNWQEMHGGDLANVDPRKWLLTQLRLARADERKQAYEDGKNAAVDYIDEVVCSYRYEPISVYGADFVTMLEEARKA